MLLNYQGLDGYILFLDVHFKLTEESQYIISKLFFSTQAGCMKKEVLAVKSALQLNHGC